MDAGTLVTGRATPTDAMHIATPMACVKVTASRGTKGNAASVPSAFAIARFLRDRVGEKGRRAWPPRSSSRERMVARTWESGDVDMVSCFSGPVDDLRPSASHKQVGMY